MEILVILPARDLLARYSYIARELPHMTVSMGDILNPMLKNLNAEPLNAARDDLVSDAFIKGIEDYLLDLFYEQSGNDTVGGGIDGVFLSEPVWSELVYLVAYVYHRIIRQRDTFLMQIPNGFISELSFNRWFGNDIEIRIGYVLYRHELV